MNKQEAEEILEALEEWKDISCCCHGAPPCDKCVNTSPPEVIGEAKE